MDAFYFGIFLVCASTLMYEVVFTRMLSVLCWYYLAFVAISMAMSGMTAGALERVSRNKRLLLRATIPVHRAVRDLT